MKRVFEAYLKYRYGQAGALTPGQKLAVVQQLRREAEENGRVPISETTTAVLPVTDTRVQAVLRGEPISVGSANISPKRRKTSSGGKQMNIQSWPLWAKLSVLVAIPIVVFVIGFFLLGVGGHSSEVSEAPTPTVSAQTAAPTEMVEPPGTGGDVFHPPSPTPSPPATPMPAPTPTPVPAPPVASDSLHPAQDADGVVSIDIAGARFVLSAAKVNEQGLWQPEGPEWLPGTVVRPVVAIPASMLDANVLRPGMPIVVHRRDGQIWSYAIESAMDVSRTQIEVMYQDRPGVVIILVPPEPESKRRVILGTPEFDIHPTPTPVSVSSSSATPRKVRAIVRTGPLRLHEAPSLTSKVLTVLDAGSVVYVVLDGPPMAADGYSWLHVWVPDGKGQTGTTGWVAEKYLVLPPLP